MLDDKLFPTFTETIDRLTGERDAEKMAHHKAAIEAKEALKKAEIIEEVSLNREITVQRYEQTL